jgi:hypothetical protein
MTMNIANVVPLTGLTMEAVNLIEVLWHQTFMRSSENILPPEYVLRHWQFVHNRWLANPRTASPPLRKCDAEELVNILEEIRRHDLAVMLQQAIDRQ